MSYFDGIKVGDRVWSIEYGWGFVKELKNTCYPIVVQFDSEDHQQFTMNGKFFTNSPNQSLFWDEVKITPPPRPKVKEKKKIECVANVYECLKMSGDLCNDNRSFYFYLENNSADINSVKDRIAVAKVTIEWEE